MGKWFHEIGLEEIVPLKIFQDRHEVEESLLASQNPSDIHNLNAYLCVNCLLFSTKTDELFLRQTLINISLNLFLTQHGCVRPKCDELSTDRQFYTFDLLRSFCLLQTRLEEFDHAWVLPLQKFTHFALLSYDPVELHFIHHHICKDSQTWLLHLPKWSLASFVW